MNLKDLMPQFKKGNKIIIQQRTQQGENQIKDSQIANQITNITIADSSIGDLIKELLGANALNESSREFKEIILPIDKLISAGKTNLAIDKYTDLIESEDFQKYSKNEKFLVYVGILNCHINKQADEGEITKWSTMIEALGEVEGIHRYYFIKAVWKYNLKDFKVAKVLNSQAIKTKPDYIKARSCDLLIKCSFGEITYEEAKEGFKKLLETPGLRVDELSSIHGFIGDAAFNNRDFCLAKSSYKESNNYVQSLIKQIGYAICIYHTSFKNIKEGNRVDLHDIDYGLLHDSEELLEEIYLSSVC
jgi:tetratricopeptide (TPR) repeat protein